MPSRFLRTLSRQTSRRTLPLREMRPRYWMTWLAEKFAQAISWNIDVALHFPSRGSIDDVFNGDFQRESQPLWGASPFNNHIFIYRRGTGVSPALGHSIRQDA